MRAYLRWAVRKRRVWVTFVAMLVAIVLTLGEGRPMWTVTVATYMAMMWLMSLRFQYEAEHPEIGAAREEKFQAEVDKVLWRYEREAAARQRLEADKAESLGSPGTE